MPTVQHEFTDKITEILNIYFPEQGSKILDYSELLQYLTPFYIESAPEFDCRRNAIRKPEETKGEYYRVTITNSDDSCCIPASSSCC